MPRRFLITIPLLLSCCLAAQPDVVLEALSTTFTQPTDLVFDGVNPNLIYVVEKAGIINRYDMTDNSVEMVLDLSTEVSTRSEGGALGMTFHPAYPDSNYVYVNYTVPATGGQAVLTSRISRFTLDNVGIVLDLTERVLLSIPQPADNHNAGDLAFGPDGFLYIPLGDGGGGNDQFDTAQDPATWLGKLLRIDVDTTTGGLNYGLPPDNPYIGAVDTLPEIWAMGLRNPWRISFDRQTGDLWIADVGQGRREEVNRLMAGTGAGTNFGWNCREGLIAFSSPSDRCAGRVAAAFTDPVLDYAHDTNQRVNGTSVTGGFVYRGPAADLQGYYVFGDFGRSRLFLYPADSDAGEEDIEVYENLATSQISTFGEGIDGDLYVADFSGTIYKVTTEAATSVGDVGFRKSRMHVYPNPATNRLTLDLPSAVSGRSAVTFRSVDGKLVAAAAGVTFDNGRADLDTPGVPEGLYILSTHLGGSRYVARVTLQ